MVKESWLGHDYRLAQRPDGSCVFLMEDGLCRIHKELGFDAKPLVCRMFPLQIVPRDHSAVVTIRRACPSAAADLGQTVEEQLEFARQLARERHLADAAPNPPALKAGEAASWPVARAALHCFQQLLTDERYPAVRRLVHALTAARLLTQAKTKALDDRQFRELLKVLEENVAGEVGHLFSERRPPSRAGSVLFRQTAIEFARLHPRFIVRPSWRARWNLLTAALRVVRGRGELPPMEPAFPSARFDQLEEPLGALPPVILQPFVRMLETTAVSWSYALSNRNGWSIIDSVRMLALTQAVGLWLLRWRAIDEEPQAGHVPEIVTALDRGQGFASLSGAKQRHRVTVLAQLGDLERLIVWYAR